MSKASDHKINEVIKRECEIFTIHMNDGWDWILATFDEKSGLVAIHSSYVTCAYSWPMPGRGRETLKEFFLDAGEDYLCDKFSYGHERTFRERFDSDKSIKFIKKHVCNLRRENRIGKETVREWYDGLNDMDDDCENSDYFYRQLEDIGYDEKLLEELGSDWYEYLQYVPSSEYNALKNVVIPIIKKALQDEANSARTA